VQVVECDNEEHEAERAVARIQVLRASLLGDRRVTAAARPTGATSPSCTAPTTRHALFEQALRKAQIPYKVSGGQSFFDRAEIKDLCAWLRLLVNNDDDPAFLRAVTTPKRGIGHHAGRWASSRASGRSACSRRCSRSPLLAHAEARRRSAAARVRPLRERPGAPRPPHLRGAKTPRPLLLEWLKDIGYEQHLYDNEDSEKLAAARWTNVLDFIDWVAKRCGGEIENDGGMSVESEKKSVLDVAQTISVITSLAERNADQNVVTLSTLHASKGLEWPHVVLAGVNEGSLPFKRDEEDMTPQRWRKSAD
jgi:ATP-dependent DNA helicase Rep